MITPYLMFNRECSEAFQLYKEAFNGEMIAYQTYGDMPPNPEFPIADSDRDLVLHAELKLSASGTILGSDSQHDRGNGGKVSISVELESEEQARHAWDKLQDGGSAGMDLQQTFFAKLHGSLTDRFGVNWMFTVR